MPSLSLTRRLQLFFYSNGNIAGLALSLLGPLLLFAGFIGPGWLWLTLALYGLGCLLGFGLTPKAASFERALQGQFSAQEIAERMDALMTEAKPLLSADMLAHLESVRTSVREVLPALAEARQFDDGLYTVRETVFNYLPQTLANYAALPPVFRSTQVVKEDKTAKQLLTEQLILLDEEMRRVVANVAASDTQALIANGSFLQQKFAQQDFLS